MWYVIQTVSGEEAEIIAIIQKAVPESLYQKCFFPLCETVFKSAGIHRRTETLFPGYVFIDTESPDALFLELRKISSLSKLLGNGDRQSGYAFVALKEEEKVFLKNLLNEDSENTVRLSRVWCEQKPDGGRCISRIEGPLSHYADKIVKVDFKNRRAFIELEFLGEKRRIRLGIRMPEDEEVSREAVQAEKKDQIVNQGKKVKPGSRIRIVRGRYRGIETAALETDESRGIVWIPIKVSGRKTQMKLDITDVEVIK